MCALSENEFMKISSYSISKKIWNSLTMVSKGMNQVKENKISRLTREYESFKILPNESIYETYARLVIIVNKLGCLGKKYPDKENIQKLL